MRRHSVFLVPAGVALGLVGFLAPSAAAASPHFVGTPTATRSGNNLIVSGKEAGLGDQTSVSISVTADAQCINPGGNKPSAENKTSVGNTGTFPVRNGQTTFKVTLTATFKPKCSPPMTVEYSNVVINDFTNGLTFTLSGPF